MERFRTITISLIRHAPAIYPKDTLPPHDSDVDLTDIGQLKNLAKMLPREAVWWVSPLQRCIKTAQALKDHGGIAGTTEVFNALEEQHYGDWHGKPVSDIWRQLEDGPKSNWHFLHPEIRPPNGESFVDIVARLAPVMDRITAAKSDDIIIFTHGMVIRALVGMAFGFTPEQSLAMSVDNLSLTQISFLPENPGLRDDAGCRWQLRRLNQTFRN
jgi:alpha-ribazole phosphatase